MTPAQVIQLDPTPLVVGIDGGGTRTRVVLADAHGTELARAEGGGTALQPGHEGVAADIIKSLIGDVLTKVKRKLEEASGHIEQTEVDEATLHAYTLHRDGGVLVLALAAIEMAATCCLTALMGSSVGGSCHGHVANVNE